MRTITTHNDPALTIEALDELGTDGVCAYYRVTVHHTEGITHEYTGTWSLYFQHGTGVFHHDGLTDAALLAVVRDRLEARQRGPAASAEGDVAMSCVTWAMEALAEVAKEQEERTG